MKAKTKQLIEQFKLPFSSIPVRPKVLRSKEESDKWVKELLARPVSAKEVQS